MTQKKCRNIIAILSILLIIATIIPNNVFAKTDLGLGDDLGAYKEEANLNKDVLGVVNYIIGIISAIGVAVSVISLMAIGIKYMLGSIEEKAQYKETFKPYIIGAFLLFTVSLVPQLIYELLTEFH